MEHLIEDINTALHDGYVFDKVEYDETDAALHVVFTHPTNVSGKTLSVSSLSDPESQINLA